MKRALLGAACLALSTAKATAGDYQVVPDWPKLPEGKVLGGCAGIGVDSKDHVFVFHRNGRSWSNPFPTDPLPGPTVTVIDGKTGEQVAEWGENEFIIPHGLTLDQNDNVWLTDVARQQVFKYSHDGKLLLTLGERGVAGSDATHFNLPTDVAVLPDGSFYVSDGYRNTRVAKFDATGKYLMEWGGKGSGPGQFNLPHGIVLDSRGQLVVCDRSNARLQVFDQTGKFIAEWKGIEIGRPYGVSVAPNGHIFAIDGGDQSGPRDHGKVTELDADGKVVSTFGSYGKAPGQFEIGHDIAVGHDGAVYVAEAKGRRVQKFISSHP